MVLTEGNSNIPIFIFGVCGRCSSTALQRIINSSGEICIWGEQHYLLEDILDIIIRVESFMTDSTVIKDIEHINYCFNKNEHLLYYCNAIGNIDSLKNSLIDAIKLNLKPINPRIERFGFKDIRVKSLSSLLELKKIFPDSKFIFLFRCPIAQWKSVNHYKFWPYSYNVSDFLNEYNRISQIYLEFSEIEKDSVFLQNTDIHIPEIFNKILSFIEIKNIDNRILNTKMLTEYPKNQDFFPENKLIKAHSAYINYLSMLNKVHEN